MTPELQEAIDSAKALRDLIGRGLLKKPTPEELDRLQFLAALEFTQAELEKARALSVEIENYLTAAAAGSMSRNNSESLADELLQQLRAARSKTT